MILLSDSSAHQSKVASKLIPQQNVSSIKPSKPDSWNATRFPGHGGHYYTVLTTISHLTCKEQKKLNKTIYLACPVVFIPVFESFYPGGKATKSVPRCISRHGEMDDHDILHTNRSSSWTGKPRASLDLRIVTIFVLLGSIGEGNQLLLHSTAWHWFLPEWFCYREESWCWKRTSGDALEGGVMFSFPFLHTLHYQDWHIYTKMTAISHCILPPASFYSTLRYWTLCGVT